VHSVNDFTLESNRYVKVNFKGGDLSSDSGLLLIKEFLHKIGAERLIDKVFQTNDTAKSRIHKDEQNLLQVLYQIFAAYFRDNDADELTHDPVFTTILEKEALASQPTLSRFYNRMDEDTLTQLDRITQELRRIVYSLERPTQLLMDLDSTLLETYGSQEGESYNAHYRSHGYHPLLCYDGLTGDLLKAKLRKGSDYCSNGAADFLQPLLDEFLTLYPDINLFLRGDSGFAAPSIYSQCETNGVSYVIRLKENTVLRQLAADLDEELRENTENNSVDYAVVYGEFLYQAGSWEYPRRVIL
jgi:hypothetical protein